MFSLIIFIISVALIAALVLATLHYGGHWFADDAKSLSTVDKAKFSSYAAERSAPPKFL